MYLAIENIPFDFKTHYFGIYFNETAFPTLNSDQMKVLSCNESHKYLMEYIML